MSLNLEVEFYSREEINAKYAKFLKNKRVALVGPANGTKGTLQKDIIDGYDIVVRMNLGFNIPLNIQKDIGKRVDVLYCALSNYYFSKKIITKNQMLKFKTKHNMKWFISTGTHRESILKVASFNKNGINIRQINKKSKNKIKRCVSAKPSAGFSTIWDLLKHDISELYIAGFTFYKFMIPKCQGRNRYYYSGYSPDYLNHAGSVYKHNVRGEAAWLKKKTEKDKRIKTDKFLGDILKELK